MPASFHEIGADTSWPTEATDRMNRMYRRQRHIYDGTRRYYLLGRDRLIADLQPAGAASVLEIGCGTGRNLVHTALLYPDARLFGIDVSTEMLTSALNAISRRGLTDRIRVAHGDGTAFDPQALFGIAAFDHVMISYSLSMIPTGAVFSSRPRAGSSRAAVCTSSISALWSDGQRCRASCCTAGLRCSTSPRAAILKRCCRPWPAEPTRI
jgi:SAM-dependent methyltransferase